MTKSPHPSSVDKGELLPVTVETTDYPLKHLPMALREVAENVLVECELHVLEDMARIANQAADVIEGRQAHSLPGDVGTAEREALAGYRAAVSFISADSWDGCSDCINILKAARAADFSHEQHDQSAIAAELTRIRKHYPPAALAPSAVSGDAGEVERLRGVLERIAEGVSMPALAAAEGLAGGEY